jgi:hypothetical protein
MTLKIALFCCTFLAIQATKSQDTNNWKLFRFDTVVALHVPIALDTNNVSDKLTVYFKQDGKLIYILERLSLIDYMPVAKDTDAFNEDFKKFVEGIAQGYDKTTGKVVEQKQVKRGNMLGEYFKVEATKGGKLSYFVGETYVIGDYGYVVGVIYNQPDEQDILSIRQNYFRSIEISPKAKLRIEGPPAKLPAGN